MGARVNVRSGVTFEWVGAKIARRAAIKHHYLHRAPSISYAYALWEGFRLVGVVTFGTPPSRELQVGVCPQSPNKVIELNRLWVDDGEPRNTETWFLAKALAALPPRIVVSYADMAWGHTGVVYRAANFRYAGWTDMDRKMPRFDYAIEGKHARDVYRKGGKAGRARVRRKPKVRYWTVTGNRADKRALAAMCAWPVLDYKASPPPEVVGGADGGGAAWHG